MGETNLWQGRNIEKDKIRHQIWASLLKTGAIASSQVGHIPAFLRAHEAAMQLEKLTFWADARIIKCNPDTAQIPVRIAALKANKQLLMAVPQLTQPHCFISLNRTHIEAAGLSLTEGVIAHNALKIGNPIQFEEMPFLDLVIVGCVAVDRQGGRTGKGAGFADLELGLLKSYGRVGDQTTIATTVDNLQIVDQSLPMESHDWPLKWIITPDSTIQTHPSSSRPQGLYPEKIQADQWDSIPALKKVIDRQNTGRKASQPHKK